MLKKRFKFFKVFLAVFVFSLLFFVNKMSANAKVEDLVNFPLNETGSGDHTVVANYNADENELQIIGHGTIDRDKWKQMIKISAASTFDFQWGDEDEVFDIRFIRDSVDMVRFPKDSSNFFKKFDRQIYFVNENGKAQVDTSQVKNMNGMFCEAKRFNQPLGSGFDTSFVRDMGSMFSGAKKFNQPLGDKFLTSVVNNMALMFNDAESFNQPLGDNFATNKVTDMVSMFNNAKSFNQPLGDHFVTSNVTNMGSMFKGAVNFNQEIKFNISSLKDASEIFKGCKNFNNKIVFINPNSNKDIKAGEAFEFGNDKGTYLEFSGLVRTSGKPVAIGGFSDDYTIYLDNVFVENKKANEAFIFKKNGNYRVVLQKDDKNVINYVPGKKQVILPTTKKVVDLVPIKNKLIVKVEDIVKTYDGKLLSSNDIVGSATFNNNEIAGKFSFDSDISNIINAGEYSNVDVIFEADEGNHDDIFVEIKVKINKASPSGEAEYDEVNKKGEKLANHPIKVGSINPEGKISWDDPDSTIIEKGASYNWTFTPNDTTNYKKLKGSAVLIINDATIENTTTTESTTTTSEEISDSSENTKEISIEPEPDDETKEIKDNNDKADNNDEVEGKSDTQASSGINTILIEIIAFLVGIIIAFLVFFFKGKKEK